MAMGRQEMIDALAKKGFDTSKLTEGVPDATIEEFLGKLQEGAEPHAEGDGSPMPMNDTPTEAPPDASDMGEGDRDSQIQQLVEQGFDEAELQDLSDEDLQTLIDNPDDPEGDAEEAVPPGDVQDVGEHADEEMPAEPMTAEDEVPPGEAPADGEAEEGTGDEPEESPAPGGDEEPVDDMESEQKQPIMFAEDGTGYDGDTIKEMLKAYVHPDDHEQLEKMSDDELCDAYESMSMGDSENEQGLTENPVPPQPAQAYSENAMLLKSQAELRKGQADLEKRQAATRKAQREHDLQLRRSTVDIFVENERRLGRIMPANVDMVRNRLYRAAESQAVQKFSENGKSYEKTELELQMWEIGQYPARKFSEKLGADDQLLQVKGEEQKVEQYFQSHSEEFDRHGTTKEKLVSGFKLAAKKNPSLRAEEYLSLDGR